MTEPSALSVVLGFLAFWLGVALAFTAVMAIATRLKNAARPEAVEPPVGRASKVVRSGFDTWEVPADWEPEGRRGA